MTKKVTEWTKTVCCLLSLQSHCFLPQAAGSCSPLWLFPILFFLPHMAAANAFLLLPSQSRTCDSMEKSNFSIPLSPLGSSSQRNIIQTERMGEQLEKYLMYLPCSWNPPSASASSYCRGWEDEPGNLCSNPAEWVLPIFQVNPHRYSLVQYPKQNIGGMRHVTFFLASTQMNSSDTESVAAIPMNLVTSVTWPSWVSPINVREINQL